MTHISKKNNEIEMFNLMEQGSFRKA